MMKTKRLLMLLLIAVLCLFLCVGCNSKYIGKDKAKEIALANAGVAAEDIHDYECELDKKRGAAIYEIDFNVDFDEHEYAIDATTGEILKSKVD